MKQEQHEAASPGENRLHTWIKRSADIGSQELEDMRRVLSAEERARAARMPCARDFIAAHWLLRTSLSALCGLSADELRFVVDDFGKPSLAPIHESDLRFSLSHTQGCVAVAVMCGRAVGIDIESRARRRDFAALAQRYFAPDEVEQVLTRDDEARAERFLRIWTLKESYLKARGIGIRIALDSFSFALDASDAVSFRAPAGELEGAWRFESREVEGGFVLAHAHATS